MMPTSDTPDGVKINKATARVGRGMSRKAGGAVVDADRWEEATVPRASEVKTVPSPAGWAEGQIVTLVRDTLSGSWTLPPLYRVAEVERRDGSRLTPESITFVPGDGSGNTVEAEINEMGRMMGGKNDPLTVQRVLDAMVVEMFR